MKNQTIIAFRFFGFIFSALICLFALIYDAWKVALHWDAVNWPVAIATVSTSGTSTCNKNGNYGPSIWYSYTIKDKNYADVARGSEFSYCGSADKALAIADRYRPGSLIQIHVDPASPGESAIFVPMLENASATRVEALKNLGVFALLFVVITALSAFYFTQHRSVLAGMWANDDG